MSIFSRRSSSAREDLGVGHLSNVPSLPHIFQVPILNVQSLSLMGEAMASDLGPLEDVPGILVGLWYWARLG